MPKWLSLFDHEFYKQHDEVAMSSLLGHNLANFFLWYHRKVWLQNCHFEFKPAICFAGNIISKTSVIF